MVLLAAASIAAGIWAFRLNDPIVTKLVALIPDYDLERDAARRRLLKSRVAQRVQIVVSILGVLAAVWLWFSTNDSITRLTARVDALPAAQKPIVLEDNQVQAFQSYLKAQKTDFKGTMMAVLPECEPDLQRYAGKLTDMLRSVNLGGYYKQDGCGSNPPANGKGVYLVIDKSIIADPRTLVLINAFKVAGIPITPLRSTDPAGPFSFTFLING